MAQIIVESLYNAGVRVAFGIPGAKVDALFDCLTDHPEIRLIICRHEQNAAMMAAAVGRISGIPGVCLATSGPGAGNLTTGLVTATTEGDPVVAIIGSVPRLLSTKHTHQSMPAVDILRPASKSATSIVRLVQERTSVSLILKLMNPRKWKTRLLRSFCLLFEPPRHLQKEPLSYRSLWMLLGESQRSMHFHHELPRRLCMVHLQKTTLRRSHA